jgi:hypothetical protein
MKWILGVSLTIAVAMGWVATAMVPAAPVTIDDVSLKFIPSQTQAIVFVDVIALRNAPLFMEALKGKNPDYPNKLDEFIRTTGFDPQRDLDRVTFAKLGAKDGLAIVQGRFQKPKVEQFLKNEGARTESYLGHTIYRDTESAYVLLDNVVLTGEYDAVKKGVDQMQLPGSAPLRKELVAAIQSIEPGNQLWAVGDLTVNDLGAVGVRGPAPVTEMLKTLKSGTYQMRIDTGLHARATGTFGDAESAQNLGDMARGMLSLMKVQMAKQRPDVTQLLSGIQVNYTGTTVTLQIEESAEQLKMLKNLDSAIPKVLQ